MYKLKNIIIPSSSNINDKYFALVGFAKNGPVRTPFQIKEKIDSTFVLGDCPLEKAAALLRKRGINPLIFRLNGSEGEAELRDKFDNVIGLFKSVENTDYVDEIIISISPTNLKVTGIVTEKIFEFRYYRDLSELAEAINSEAYYGNSEVTLDIYQPNMRLEDLTEIEYDISINGASSEEHYISTFTEEEDFEKYQMQLEKLKEELLEGYEENGEIVYSVNNELSSFDIDTILTPDFVYENNPEIPFIMGQFCMSKSKQQDSFCNYVLGSMYFSEIDSEETPYESMKNELIALKANSNKEYMKHVEIVLGVESYNDEEKIPLSIKYALERFLLPIENSATNKEIHDIQTLFSKLSKLDIASLTSSGYICIVPSIRKNYVAYKSQTFIEDNSLIMSKPHYSRSTKYYAREIIKPLEDFIGDTINSINLKEIESIISDKIKSLNSLNIYKDIDYSMKTSPTGEVLITLSFIINGELETISTSAAYDSSRVVLEWV